MVGRSPGLRRSASRNRAAGGTASASPVEAGGVGVRARRGKVGAPAAVGNHAAALEMVTMQNGVFGAVSSSVDLLEVLS